MTRSIRFGTLKITLPIGRTILNTAAILAITIGLPEVAGRTGFLLPYVLRPMVSGHDSLGARLETLAAIERQYGPVDCFFIGSSTVARGIDPRVISQAITTSTGRPIRCYNFGVAGLTFPGAARLAQILAARYHPRLIVYAMNYRDTGTGFRLGIPWADQQLGQPSLQGWLETESIAYRYFLGLTDKATPLRPLLPNTGPSMYGYSPIDVVSDVAAPPGQETDYYHIWHDFQIARRQTFITWLRTFLSLKTTRTSLIVVEIPIPPSLLDISSEGRQSHQEFTDRMSAESRLQHVPFLPEPDEEIIPANGWKDYIHLNQTGATAFSGWLAQQLAELARQGAVANPTP